MDRLALEVVAEAPVAEHLEERVVARRPADLLEVVVLAGDAQAALVVDRAVVRRAVSAPVRTSLNWTIPEFVNSSVWSPAGTRLALGTTRVTALGEELEEPPPDLGGGEERDPGIRRSHRERATSGTMTSARNGTEPVRSARGRGVRTRVGPGTAGSRVEPRPVEVQSGAARTAHQVGATSGPSRRP